MSIAVDQVLEPALESEAALPGRWLDRFNAALRAGSPAAIAHLFATESHYRDVLAFTWDLTPAAGAEQIARGFKWTMGEDGAGHQMMIRRRYGGYFLDAGCAGLIIKGEIANPSRAQARLGFRIHPSSTCAAITSFWISLAPS